MGAALLVIGAIATYLVATVAWLRRENARLTGERDRRLYQIKSLTAEAQEHKRAQGVGHWAAEAQKLAEERDALRRRLSDLVAKGKCVVADRDHWETEATRLVVELGAASASDEKFKSAKRAFAQAFHPNNGGAEGLEKTVRTAVFTIFWPVIEGIERDSGTAR